MSGPKCMERVLDYSSSFMGRQCRRPAVEGEGSSAKCKIHSAAAVAARRAKQSARWKANEKAFARRSAIHAAEREVLEAALRYAKACDDTKKPGADAVEVGLAWEFEHGAFMLSVRSYRALIEAESK